MSVSSAVNLFFSVCQAACVLISTHIIIVFLSQLHETLKMSNIDARQPVMTHWLLLLALESVFSERA